MYVTMVRKLKKSKRKQKKPKVVSSTLKIHSRVSSKKTSKRKRKDVRNLQKKQIHSMMSQGLSDQKSNSSKPSSSQEESSQGTSENNIEASGEKVGDDQKSDNDDDDEDKTNDSDDHHETIINWSSSEDESLKENFNASTVNIDFDNSKQDEDESVNMFSSDDEPGEMRFHLSPPKKLQKLDLIEKSTNGYEVMGDDDDNTKILRNIQNNNDGEDFSLNDEDEDDQLQNEQDDEVENYEDDQIQNEQDEVENYEDDQPENEQNNELQDEEDDEVENYEDEQLQNEQDNEPQDEDGEENYEDDQLQNEQDNEPQDEDGEENYEDDQLQNEEEDEVENYEYDQLQNEQDNELQDEEDDEVENYEDDQAQNEQEDEVENYEDGQLQNEQDNELQDEDDEVENYEDDQQQNYVDNELQDDEDQQNCEDDQEMSDSDLNITNSGRKSKRVSARLAAKVAAKRCREIAKEEYKSAMEYMENIQRRSGFHRVKVKKEDTRKKTDEKIVLKEVRVNLIDCYKFPELAGVPFLPKKIKSSHRKKTQKLRNPQVNLIDCCKYPIVAKGKVKKIKSPEIQDEGSSSSTTEFCHDPSEDLYHQNDNSIHSDFEEVKIEAEEVEIKYQVRVPCTYCDSTFEDQFDLDVHITVHHAKIKEGISVVDYTIDVSSSSSSSDSDDSDSSSDLTFYENGYDEDCSDLPAESTISKCFICEKTFSKIGLQLHCQRVHIHECSICLATFGSITKFDYHIQESHPELHS